MGGDSFEDQYKRAWEQEIAAGKRRDNPPEDPADRKVEREVKRDSRDE